MKVSELKAELDCYEDDAEVVFKLDDEVPVESWTEDKYGYKKVSIDAELKVGFMMDYHGDLHIDLEVQEE